MSSSDPSSAPSSPAPQPGQSSVPAPAPLPEGYVSVVCPPGFTASSVKEHAGARPLYARLTYRPHHGPPRK